MSASRKDLHTEFAEAAKRFADKTDAAKVRKEVMANLERLGQVQTGDDALIFEGDKFVLPESMKGSIPAAVKYLEQYEASQETEFSFSRTYNYRRYDGANAFQRAMKRVFGTTGVGKMTHTFFGSYPPEYKIVDNGPASQIQVPQGRVEFSPLGATFAVGATRHSEYGIVFELSVEAPKKYRAHIEAFFQVVEDELKHNSIYRGKAFTGGDEPQFLDTSTTDPTKVVYSADVMVQLETNLWSLLRHTDAMRASGVDLKRSVLVEGPFGTGKTLAGQLTAKEAVDNGWTFLICRTGRDDLNETLKTAELYAPAVVWFEDIDVVAQGHSSEQISRLLDSLDGITNKGKAVVAGFTTNYVNKIQKGVLRPGRLDAVIHIGALDDAGLTALIKSVLPEELRGDIDYEVVVDAFRGFLPAFAKEAAVRAVRYAISRGKGTPEPVTTEDLVNAANGLKPQLALMNEAQEGVKPDLLEQAFIRVLHEGVKDVEIRDDDDDFDGRLVVKSRG